MTTAYVNHDDDDDIENDSDVKNHPQGMTTYYDDDIGTQEEEKISQSPSVSEQQRYSPKMMISSTPTTESMEVLDIDSLKIDRNVKANSLGEGGCGFVWKGYFFPLSQQLTDPHLPSLSLPHLPKKKNK